MAARTTIRIDFRKSAMPRRGERAPFPETTLPNTGFDRKRGLRFPLPEGAALAFPSAGRINDAAGSLSVAFSLDEGDAGGQIIQTWERYFKLSVGNEIALTAYGHELKMAWTLKPGVAYTVEADWDCTVGLSLRLLEAGRMVRRHARNATWKPYGQRWYPIQIGGQLASTWPGKRSWEDLFTGWIVEVSCCGVPRHAPGVTRVPRRPEESGSDRGIPRAAGITVLELHDPPILDSPHRFDLPPKRLANFRKCRREHPELAELYFGAATPLTGLRAVARHVAELWPHTDYWPWPREIFVERGDILLKHIKQGDTAGMCGGYAHTMEEALWCLGVPARRTQVYGHSSLEVYDHGHDKWICLEADPTCQTGHWEDVHGTPLSVGEMIAVNEEDLREPGAFQRNVRHLPLGSQFPTGGHNIPRPEKWFRYAYVLMGFYRGDYHGERRRPSSWYLPPNLLSERAEPYTPGHMQTLLDDWRPLYWSCDRVRVGPRWKEKGCTLSLRLRAFNVSMPDGFVARVDGGRRRKAKDAFEWRLHPGINRIEIRAAGKLGVEGHPWRAVLHRRP